jgi:hypothetical protein
MLLRRLKHLIDVRTIDRKIADKSDLELVLDSFDGLNLNGGISVSSRDFNLNQASLAQVSDFVREQIGDDSKRYTSGRYQVYKNGKLEYHYIDVECGKKSASIGANRVRYPSDNKFNIFCKISR